MLTLSNRQQILIGFMLALMMLFTRSHHWASLYFLPDATWAIFFLLGVYVRALWVVPALIAASVMIDYGVITLGGVSDFCIFPAYWWLIPAYLVLFMGGRFYARGHSVSPRGWPRLAGVALAAVVVAELFSSGGFYVFSGRFSEPTLAGFVPRFAEYFPHTLRSFALYLGVAAAVHLTLAVIFRRGADATQAEGSPS